MTPLTILGLAVLMTGTAFLSGIFGMAGGMILIGVLLALLPLPVAMALHAITQMASNGWRAVLWRRHIVWSQLGFYALGCLAAVGLWTAVLFVPPKWLSLICLGLVPFVVRALPTGLRPNPDSRSQGFGYGVMAMSLMLLTGVSGPLLDTFFLGAKHGDRRKIVATKATAQVFAHGLKLFYFGGLAAGAAALDPVLVAVAVTASILGTTLARRVLEAMSDAQFRLWAGRIITTIAVWYLAQGTWLLIAPVDGG